MQFSSDKLFDVVGVGNALMDLLVEVDDAYIEQLGLEKGNTYFVDADTALARLEDFETTGLTAIPGGAAANAIKTAAVLGGKTALFASVGNDTYGQAYIAAMTEHGVDARIVQQEQVTGHALTFITPDAERTFSDHLGATLLLRPDDLDISLIQAAKILHLEAYQLEGETKATVQTAIAAAKAADTKISLDLTDPLLVERHFDLFQTLVRNDIDILFANEAEAKAFTGKEEREALDVMSGLVDIAVVKVGEQGSFISHGGAVTEVTAVTTTPVDTTGAGDVYAGAFLFAITNGYTLAEAGALAAAKAARIITEVGVPAEVLQD